MKYTEPVRAKYNNEENKVSISISGSEDLVVTRKVTVDEFRRIMAHMNAVLYDIDQEIK
jgi:hypothetical protein